MLLGCLSSFWLHSDQTWPPQALRALLGPWAVGEAGAGGGAQCRPRRFAANWKYCTWLELASLGPGAIAGAAAAALPCLEQTRACVGAGGLSLLHLLLSAALMVFLAEKNNLRLICG